MDVHKQLPTVSVSPAVLIAAASLVAVFILAMIVAENARNVAHGIYHAVLSWQIFHELNQTPFSDPPMLELIVSRAMSRSKLDLFNTDGSPDKSDFAPQIQAVFSDAWSTTALNSSQGQASTIPPRGVFRKFILDASIIDLSRRLVLVNALINNNKERTPSNGDTAEENAAAVALIDSMELPPIVILLAAPFCGGSTLRKCKSNAASVFSEKSYNLERKEGYYVPTVADIGSIIPTFATGPSDKSAKKLRSSGIPDQEQQFASLLRWFTSKKERIELLNDEDFRFGKGCYLNLPKLRESQTEQSSEASTRLFLQILKLHISKLPVPPTHIILEGHEHAAHIPALAALLSTATVAADNELRVPPLRVVVIEPDLKGKGMRKYIRQRAVVRRLVLRNVRDEMQAAVENEVLQWKRDVVEAGIKIAQKQQRVHIGENSSGVDAVAVLRIDEADLNDEFVGSGDDSGSGELRTKCDVVGGRGLTLQEESTLQEQKDPHAPIPRLILQTYKTSTLPEWQLETGSNNRTMWFVSWEIANPTYLHRVLDDSMATEFMRREFSGRVFQAYTKMPLVVLRADLLRYAMVYVWGGVYADSDTECLGSVDNWIGPHSNATLVASVEWYKNTHKLASDIYKRTQLVQWTFAAAPGHPVFRSIIDSITDRVHAATSSFLLNSDNVEFIGGPQVFTRFVEQYLQKQGETLEIMSAVDKWDSSGKRVYFGNSGVVVLPMYSFMAQLDPVRERPTRFVSHYFAGTYLENGWKNGGGRMEKEKKADLDDGLWSPNVAEKHKLQIVFRNLTYTVDIKDQNAKSSFFKSQKIPKKLLNNVSGIFQPARLTAVMGASGAGKTSLLQVLAGEARQGSLSGLILINGENVGGNMKKVSGFVFQDDCILATMTVKEAITMSAILRLPESMSLEDKMQAVTQTIKLLNLEKCSGTIIGNASIKGVSGGERKRTAMAMEIITNPS
ncbi:ABC transporter G member 24, partial [Physocladia obscura]